MNTNWLGIHGPTQWSNSLKGQKTWLSSEHNLYDAILHQLNDWGVVLPRTVAQRCLFNIALGRVGWLFIFLTIQSTLIRGVIFLSSFSFLTSKTCNDLIGQIIAPGVGISLLCVRLFQLIHMNANDSLENEYAHCVRIIFNGLVRQWWQW
jgi:hypothetical protein